MSLSPVSIATAIAGLSPIDTNIKVRDLGSMLDNVTNRATPLLQPFAPLFISDVTFQPQSLGAGLIRKSDFIYAMNWRFFFQPVGQNRKMADVYEGLVDKTTNIVEAIIENDKLATAVNITLERISVFGIVDDPARNQHFGCDIRLDILEFMT